MKSATEKGEFIYDYKYDILVLKILNKEYKMSFEFQNFVIDIDKNNKIMGIRILDVSEVTGLDKYAFKSLHHGEFKASIKDNVVTVRVKFVSKVRNKMIPIFTQEKDFVQQFSSHLGSKTKFADAEIVVPQVTV